MYCFITTYLLDKEDEESIIGIDGSEFEYDNR